MVFCQENLVFSQEDFKQTLSAAMQGDAEAQRCIGYCYHTGTIVDIDYQKALNWYQKAANQENAQAQFNIGIIYMEISGGPMNSAKIDSAKKYIELAFRNMPELKYSLFENANMGDILSQRIIASLYFSGIAMEQNPNKAFYWWQQAANQGSGPDQYRVGICYACGTGVDVSLDSAKKYLELASQQNVPQSKEKLQEIEKLKKSYLSIKALELIPFYRANKFLPPGVRIIILILFLIFILIKIPIMVTEYHSGKSKEGNSLKDRSFLSNPKFVPIDENMVEYCKKIENIKLYPTESRILFTWSKYKKTRTIVLAILYAIGVVLLSMNISFSLILVGVVGLIIFWSALFNNIPTIPSIISYITGIYSSVCLSIGLHKLWFLFFLIYLLSTIVMVLYPFFVYTELNIKNRTISKKIFWIQSSIRPMEELVELDWGEKETLLLIFDNNNEDVIRKVIRKLFGKLLPEKSLIRQKRIEYNIHIENDLHKKIIADFIEELFGEVGEMKI